jgi:hypothetical protein
MAEVTVWKGALPLLVLAFLDRGSEQLLGWDVAFENQ